jgi:RNA polymerase sigma factor (sigma-70 family)
MNGRDPQFEAMYRKHFGRVYRFFHITHHIADDEAQDLAQETFKRVYEGFDQYRAEAEWSYLQTTAKRVLLNRIRGENTWKRKADIVEIDDPEVFFDPPAPEGPDLATRQEIERLAQAMTELSPSQRESVGLWIQGFKYEEIAKVLKISVDAVKSRLRDAKRYLRSRVRGES